MLIFGHCVTDRLMKADLERTTSLPTDQAVLEAMKRFEELNNDNVPLAASVLPVTERILQVRQTCRPVDHQS